MVDADWHAFCQATCKGIEGSDWGELYDYYKEMSGAAGARKPSESQKREATLEGRRQEVVERISMAQKARTTFWEGIERDWNCGKSTSKTQLWHWTKL